MYACCVDRVGVYEKKLKLLKICVFCGVLGCVCCVYRVGVYTRENSGGQSSVRNFILFLKILKKLGNQHTVIHMIFVHICTYIYIYI